MTLKAHTNNGKLVQMNKAGDYMDNQPFFQVTISTWKAETGTWFGLRSKMAYTAEQAEELYSKGVAWTER